MPLIEKLGSFYLGREYDPELDQTLNRPVNYDSRDLTTHAVCVGMTGSGKTGLCIDLLEEAAIDGVPAIIVDPKGDITNLLLAFPDLSQADFLPWINPEDADGRGLTPEAYAAQVAETWRNGLAAWDQGPERVRLLKEAADFAIYTPGSEAGLPISVLGSIKAPPLDWDTEAETLRDRIQGIVSALLALVGETGDPLRSREHILLSNILEHAWRAGRDMDIAGLILAVQRPPFDKLGVFDLEAFFPEKERFGLAMLLNNLIASPGFAGWTAGEPLDIPALLHDRAGKPRHSIFYIAHLNDAERMFFVTILLEQLIGWMRAQPGTTSLRALFYMDEIFGFFPPVSEPPSKRPLITLLKQARAFGIGIVLAAQNPIDVDYKGLSNAGTWFVGKLQTERDKARLMEGLSDALSSRGAGTDTRALNDLISSLRERTFLLHNVHAKSPVVFQTRWAMSYLRGPLTRQQIKQLMAPRKAAAQRGANPDPAPASARDGGVVSEPASNAEAGNWAGSPPVLPDAIRQVYLPLTLTAEAAAAAVGEHAGVPIIPTRSRPVYEPALLGLATVHFVDRKLELDESRQLSYLLLLADVGPAIDWKDGWAASLDGRQLLLAPEPGAGFSTELTPALAGVKNLTAIGNSFGDYLYRTQAYSLLHNPTLKLYAEPSETERDFRARCQHVAREQRDAAVDRLTDKYDPQFKRLQARQDKAQAELDQAQAEYGEGKRDARFSTVDSVVGSLGLFGRKKRVADRAHAAATRKADAAKAEISAAEADIAGIQADMAEARSQMQAEAGALTQKWVQAAADVQELRIKPRKADVDVQMVALAWAASWQITYSDAGGLPCTETVPAYPLQ